MRYDDLHDIVKNSFINFHCKGFDYLCLARSPQLTVKAYFFEGEVSQLPEAVVPHDHRYDFYTHVLAGSVVNRTYDLAPLVTEAPRTHRAQMFRYMTPLNGGDGFEWAREVAMREKGAFKYERDKSYFSAHTDIHTISIDDPQTVLLLVQHEDKVPVDEHTFAFRFGNGKEVPSLDGLYDKPDEDYVLKRLEQIKELMR